MAPQVLHNNKVKFPKDILLHCSVHQHGRRDVRGNHQFSIILTKQITVTWFLLAEEDPHKEVRVQWARLNGVLKMNNVDSTTIPRSPSAMAQENSDMTKAREYCLVFTGFNLHEQALKNWLRTCCKPVRYITLCHLLKTS